MMAERGSARLLEEVLGVSDEERKWSGNASRGEEGCWRWLGWLLAILGKNILADIAGWWWWWWSRWCDLFFSPH